MKMMNFVHLIGSIELVELEKKQYNNLNIRKSLVRFAVIKIELIRLSSVRFEIHF